jgi:hypothetical protein
VAEDWPKDSNNQGEEGDWTLLMVKLLCKSQRVPEKGRLGLLGPRTTGKRSLGELEWSFDFGAGIDAGG